MAVAQAMSSLEIACFGVKDCKLMHRRVLVTPMRWELGGVADCESVCLDTSFGNERTVVWILTCRRRLKNSSEPLSCKRPEVLVLWRAFESVSEARNVCIPGVGDSR